VFRLVREFAGDGFDVAVAGRVLRVSRSGYYAWRSRPPSARLIADARLQNDILAAFTASRGSYRAPRVHAELRLGLGVRCGRKRILRLMLGARLVSVGYRRRRRRQPAPAPDEDLVSRRFVADHPDRLWCTDITEHPPPKARSTAPRSSTGSAGRLSVGPSPTTCAQSWSSTPWRWPADAADPHRARSCTPIAARDTPAGSSVTDYAPPACSARWAGSPARWRTP